MRHIILLLFRLIGRFLRLIRRTWSIISIVIVVALIGLNVLTLVSSLAYRVASSALDLISEGASLRSRTDAEMRRVTAELAASDARLTSLEQDLGQARQRQAEFQDRAHTSQLQLEKVDAERARLDASVARIEADLKTERSKVTSLSSELADARSETSRISALAESDRAQRQAAQTELESMHTKRAAQTEMIDRRTKAIEIRSRNLVAREVAAMPLEGIPWFGIATIVAVTGLELKDLCDTSKDMQAIRDSFGLTDPISEGGNEVCGQDILTVKELLAWLQDGPDGRMEERCRRLVEDLGLSLPDECPKEEILPPKPPSPGDEEPRVLPPRSQQLSPDAP